MIRREFDVTLDIYATQVKTYIAGTTTKMTPWFIKDDKVDCALNLKVYKNSVAVDCTGYQAQAFFYDEDNVLLDTVTGSVVVSDTDNEYLILIDGDVTVAVGNISCIISLYRDVNDDLDFVDEEDSKISFPSFRIKIK